MSLVISLRSEIRKTKRTAAFYFTIVGAALVPTLSLLDISTEGLHSSLRADPFNAIFKGEMNFLVIFPLFIILACTLVPQIEHRNNTWKQLLASPQTKLNIYLSKYLSVLALMLLFMIITHLCYFISAVIVHFALPELNLLNHPLNGFRILSNAANSVTFLLALSAIQFWIGLRFRNFIIPIAVGLGLWVAGTLLVVEYHSGAAKYFPYSYHTFNYLPTTRSGLQQVGLTSIGYTILFLGLGYWDFRNRKS